MITQEIRRNFLKYFREKTHSIVPSSPVVPHDDPTLLFINAGMNQFKDVFLGKSTRDYTKAASSQKCIRVGGKHNDLENVGHTLRHLTFFEMLGNFSFGDYFKEDAIKFSWEVSTEVFGFDPENIWPTVFNDDNEAFEIWETLVPAERITRFGEKSNFWAMGDTGPCGPCSELLYDRGKGFGAAKNPKEDVDETRFLEFWNLVFMEYNRDENGLMNPLPKPSIDTGAGLERIVNLKMGVNSVYDTDVLKHLIHKTEEVTGIHYSKKDESKAAAFRVIADHMRCLSFAIADGVQPSNVDRGYVLRKVLRRAVRYGRTLGMEQPFLAGLLPSLIETMGQDYPELTQAKLRIEEILTSEEEAFIRTLRRGGNILGQIVQKAQQEKRKISGDEAFKLKDTYGFPLEEILLIAKDANLSVDKKRFTELEKEARERSRSVHKSTKEIAEENVFKDFAKTHGECEFLGYDTLQCDSQVIGLVLKNTFVQTLPEGSEGIVILNKSPFYAEKGGQVGDMGKLLGEASDFQVNDCKEPFKGMIAHLGKVKKGTIHLGDNLTAIVDEKRRQKIANNHTATHLLHWALSRVLGEHIKQAGSVVEPGRLRFDFSHHKALTVSEIREIEDLVNKKIRENLHVKSYELPYEDVLQKDDIKQFFGEKYDQIVRVIDIDYSKELCGGTHTSQTGNIGLFRILKEGSIAAGVRRIEAVTGKEAEALTRNSEDLLQEIAEKLKTDPQKLQTRIEKLLEENKALAQKLEREKEAELKDVARDLLKKIVEVKGVPLIAERLSFNTDDLRTLAETTIKLLPSGVLVLGSVEKDRCQLIVRVTDNLISKGISAKEIIQQIAPIINGGGGGKANSAQAGGKSPEKLQEALDHTRQILAS